MTKPYPPVSAKIIRVLGVLLFAGVFLMAGLNAWVSYSAADARFTSVTQIPKNSVGVLLGTSRYTTSGEDNLFYTARIQAAKELYDAKKIDCLLLSGDNTSLSYNEPIQMQKSLLEVGIPAERMYLDYAGIRTLDSLIRARDIFGLTQFTVISQPFHIDRALFIAREKNLQAVGYEADSVPFFSAPTPYIREFFSRGVALYDLFFETLPKYSGERIVLEYNPDIRPIPSKICSPR
jgi:SanA protein